MAVFSNNPNRAHCSHFGDWDTNRCAWLTHQHDLLVTTTVLFIYVFVVVSHFC